MPFLKTAEHEKWGTRKFLVPHFFGVPGGQPSECGMLFALNRRLHAHSSRWRSSSAFRAETAYVDGNECGLQNIKIQKKGVEKGGTVVYNGVKW